MIRRSRFCVVISNILRGEVEKAINIYFTDFGTHVLVSFPFLLLKCILVTGIFESLLFKHQFLCGCRACCINLVVIPIAMTGYALVFQTTKFVRATCERNMNPDHCCKNCLRTFSCKFQV